MAGMGLREQSERMAEAVTDGGCISVADAVSSRYRGRISKKFCIGRDET